MKTMDNDSLSVFCTELAELLGSGIIAPEGFSLLAAQEPDRACAAAFTAVYDRCMAGAGLTEAMRAAGVFPEHMLRMMAVAEHTGAAEGVLRALAAYYDRQARLRRAVRAAVVYPAMMLVVVLAVFFVFLTEVLPVFERVFRQIGATMLPAAEAFLRFGLALSAARWWVLGALLAIALAVALFCLVPALRARAGRFFSGLFSRTRTGRRLTQARLASALALATAGDADMGEALELACAFAAGQPGAEAMARCRRGYEEGQGLAEAAAGSGLFQPVYCRMLGVAEQAGAVGRMMGDVARRAQEEAERGVDRLAGAVEPAAVILLTLLVGLLLLTVMLPLVGVMSAL